MLSGIARLRRVNRSDGAIQPSTIPRLYIDLAAGPKFSGRVSSKKDDFMKVRQPTTVYTMLFVDGDTLVVAQDT